jgi:hypothetical protein
LDRRVADYLMNHKMATAAIVAGAGRSGMVLDANNKFSDEAVRSFVLKHAG